MAYTLSTLATEIWARGFSFLNDGGAGQTRTYRWINDAMHYVDDSERWTYLAGSTSGAAPLTISDLDGVERVTQNEWALTATSRDVLLRQYGELTTTGTPVYFYLASPTVVSVYPVSTASINVTYWKVGPDLTAASDAPLMPDRYRGIIVELACAKAYRDTDDPEMAGVCQAEADRILQRMRENQALLPGETVQAIYGYSSDL